MRVGEYIRTPDGLIGKIIKIDKGSRYIDSGIVLDSYKYKLECGKWFIKDTPSYKNIIDLIQVGDYVNGYKVKEKTNDEVIVDYYCYSKELCDGHYLHWHKDYIETIVTKEQFESMEYRIGD